VLFHRLSFVGLAPTGYCGAQCVLASLSGRKRHVGASYRCCGSCELHTVIAAARLRCCGQTAFSVLVFLSVLWPDYSLWHLLLALLRFQREYPPLRVRPAL
jgi:hypothetical protein